MSNTEPASWSGTEAHSCPLRDQAQVMDVGTDFGICWRALGRACAALLAIGLVVWAGHMGLKRFVDEDLPPFYAVATFGLLGVTVAAILVGPRWARKRARSCMKLRDRFGLKFAINQTVHEAGWVDTSACVQEIMRALVYDRSFGTVIRLCRADLCTPIEPLHVPFEPCPLAGDQTFEALASAAPAGVLGLKPTPDSEPVPRPAPCVYRPSSARKLLQAFPMLAVAAAYPAARLAGLPIWGAWLGAFIVGVIAYGGLHVVRQRQSAQPEGREWFLVPGGLTVRITGLMRSDWQVKLFTRDDSVLCTHSREGPIWVLTARSQRDCETAEVTRNEMEMALRAWLSPFDPPTVEQLVDLT